MVDEKYYIFIIDCPGIYSLTKPTSNADKKSWITAEAVMGTNMRHSGRNQLQILIEGEKFAQIPTPEETWISYEAPEVSWGSVRQLPTGPFRKCIPFIPEMKQEISSTVLMDGKFAIYVEKLTHRRI